MSSWVEPLVAVLVCASFISFILFILSAADPKTQWKDVIKDALKKHGGRLPLQEIRAKIALRNKDPDAFDEAVTELQKKNKIAIESSYGIDWIVTVK